MTEPNWPPSNDAVPDQAVSSQAPQWAASNRAASNPAASNHAGSNRAAAIAASVIFGAGAVATGIVLVLSSGHDSGNQPNGNPDGFLKPTSFTATVSMQVHVGEYGTCEGGGYSDIRSGSQVEIVNQKNEVLAHGTLERSVPVSDCTFSASVEDIPSGEKMYGAKVGNVNRGVIWKNETEARSGWALSLGD